MTKLEDMIASFSRISPRELEQHAAHWGIRREIINDGRAPDRDSGLPLETDEELRERIIAEINQGGGK